MNGGFDNLTNHGRVDKLVEMLALIEKSAASNKATTAEVATMLAPLLHRIGAYREPEPNRSRIGAGPELEDYEATLPPHLQRAVRPGSHHAWNSIRDMATQASLPDLTVAMAVYLDRLGEHFG